MLVLFVGNNWNLLETPEVSPYAPSVAARQRYGLALREDGIAGPDRAGRKSASGRRRKRRSAPSLRSPGRSRIPVVVVIPEVNLADWETRQPPVWLERRRHRPLARPLRGSRSRRLDRADFAGALETAERMRELDGGACSSTWRLLARAHLGLGNLEEARRACLAEVDAARYATLAFLSAPQATTAARELLREVCPAARLLPGGPSGDLRGAHRLRSCRTAASSSTTAI